MKRTVEWIKPEDAKDGTILLAWCNGAKLPSYQLVDKDNGKWRFHDTDKLIPKGFFSYVMELPWPPNWPPKPAAEAAQR
jgi:hypothetical protein